MQLHRLRLKCHDHSKLQLLFYQLTFSEQVEALASKGSSSGGSTDPMVTALGISNGGNAVNHPTIRTTGETATMRM